LTSARSPLAALPPAMFAVCASRTALSSACLLALVVGAAAGEGRAGLRGAANGGGGDGGAARRLEAPNGKWGPYMDEWSSLPVYASEICVRCVGGYAMMYNIWDTHTNRISEWSNTISAQRTACMPVDSIKDVAEDHPVSPRIFVMGFADSFVQVAIQSIRYRPGAGQAHYTCLGSSASWYCNMDTIGHLGTVGSNSTGAVPSSSSISGAGFLEAAGEEREPNGKWGPYMNSWSLLPVHASKICVHDVGGYAMQFNLWDTYVNFISDWSSTISAQGTTCLSISSIHDVAEGHPISPRIFVKGWADSFVQVSIQSVIYEASAGQADYACFGSTTSWYCNLNTMGDLPTTSTTETSSTESSATDIPSAESSTTSACGTWYCELVRVLR